MPQETLLVCTLRRSSQTEAEQEKLSGGQSLFNQLPAKLTAFKTVEPINLPSVRCMGACDRASSTRLALSHRYPPSSYLGFR